MRILRYILLSALSLATAAEADILAYWDFGADSSTYTTAVTINRTTGTPTLALTPYSSSEVDANGKSGLAYTDPEATFHSAGRSAAFDPAYSNCGAISLNLNADGYQLSKLRWDAYTDASGDSQGPKSFDLSFSIDDGLTWTNIAASAVMMEDGGKEDFYAYEYQLSDIAGLRNQSNILLRLNNFMSGTGGECGFDNMLIEGLPVDSVNPPSIEISPNNGTIFCRHNDDVEFTVTAIELDGDSVSLSVSNAPASAIFAPLTGLSPQTSTFSWNTDEYGLAQPTFIATDKDGSTEQIVEIQVMSDQASLVLNEANAVGKSDFITTADPFFGVQPGNGGNWFELIITQDHVDLRGWQLCWAETGSASIESRILWYPDASVAQGIITLSQHADLSDLRMGTVLTIIEDSTEGVASDLVIAPTLDDWHINICTEEEVQLSNRYASTDCNNSYDAGSFSVGSDGWLLAIYDDEGNMTAPTTGERYNDCTATVSDTEMLALDDELDSRIVSGEQYSDMDRSSFGTLNLLKTSPDEYQDSTWLRAWANFTNEQKIIINEYNAVGTGYLGGGTALDDNGEDSLLNRIASNGGSWMELLILEDHLDLRGFTVSWLESSADFVSDGTAPVNGNSAELQGVLTFADNTLWQDLRKGSIITVAQASVLTNSTGTIVFDGSKSSYNAEAGNFHIHISTTAEAAATEPLITTVANAQSSAPGYFSTGSSRWTGFISDASQTTIFGPIGEDYIEDSLSDEECMRLAADPENFDVSDYRDSKNSTMAEPNPLPGDAYQDVATLRTGIVDLPFVLNEYNVVRNGQLLKGDGSDSYFGRIDGNGGNWIELIIAEDHLDLRGWKLQWAELLDTSGTSIIWYPDAATKQGEVLFNDDLRLSDLRSGTILTLTEKLSGFADTSTDLSFDPINDDWWMNICTIENGATATPLCTTQVNATNALAGEFDVGHEDWIIQFVSPADEIVFGPFGETETPTMSLSFDEVARFENAAGSGNWFDWDDESNSTYGSLNTFGGGTQAVSTVQNWYPSADPDDLDDDGMPDAWEIEKLGGTAALPHFDADTDVVDNHSEYVAGTEPMDDSSYPRIETINVDPDVPSISFMSYVGRLYDVEYTEDLTDEVWQTETADIPGTDSLITIILDADKTAASYRISIRLAAQ